MNIRGIRTEELIHSWTIIEVFNILTLMTLRNKVTGSLQCFSDEFTVSQKLG